MLPMVLMLGLAPGVLFFNKRFRRTVTIYATAVMTLALMLEIANLVFFVNLRRRLNWASFNYPRRHARETVVLIWQMYPFGVILLVLAVVVGVLGGVLSALYPGYRAARLDPAFALSQE